MSKMIPKVLFPKTGQPIITSTTPRINLISLSLVPSFDFTIFLPPQPVSGRMNPTATAFNLSPCLPLSTFVERGIKGGEASLSSALGGANFPLVDEETPGWDLRLVRDSIHKEHGATTPVLYYVWTILFYFVSIFLVEQRQILVTFFYFCAVLHIFGNKVCIPPFEKVFLAVYG